MQYKRTYPGLSRLAHISAVMVAAAFSVVGCGGGAASNQGTSLPISVGILSPGPVVTSVSPTSVPVNAPDTIVSIYGTGITPFSKVQVNGTSVAATALPYSGYGFVTGYMLNATVPAADFVSLGTLSVTVTNPGTAPSIALTINVTLPQSPAVSYISPSAAAMGGSPFTLTVTGSGFSATSVVRWNGVAVSTTYVSLTQLTAMIPASDIQSLGTSSVYVYTPAPGGGSSGTLPFDTYVGLPANDLLYNQTNGLLYASVPSSGGTVLGNSIVPIDPNTGVIGTPIFVGSEPGKMALSSDGSTIWVGLNGAGAMREVNLNTDTAGMQFSLGSGLGTLDPPWTAVALAVMPGQPNTVAIATMGLGSGGNQVAIYDSGIARPNAPATQQNLCCSDISGIAFDSTGTILYQGGGTGYGTSTVNGTGIVSSASLNGTARTSALRIENGRAYLTSGVVLDANSGTQLGTFVTASDTNVNGPVEPDSGIGSAYMLPPNPPSSYAYPVIIAYNISTFAFEGAIPAPVLGTGSIKAPELVRWGLDGLAFTTGTEIYVLRSTLVQDLSNSQADLGVSANVPTTGATGSNLTYALTVSNAGPLAATAATLTDNIPSGAVLQSVTPSQATCSGSTVIYCDFGALNSGSSATVQIVVTALASGTLTNTATVAGPQSDPAPANNTAVSTTTVTGNAYSAVPSVTSISPAFVQAGSEAVTLTVNGTGFAPSSTVQFNGTALTTTFVNVSQLSANLPANDVATMSWAWVDVATPAPGGGTSPSLPLTVYATISLDVNHMIFDRYTQKLYATIPGTAPQVTGNSIVAIDPFLGTVSTPVNVGTNPDPLAESSDGKDLYIGLDGAQALTLVDLTTTPLTQGAVFPIVYQNSYGGYQSPASGLAVAPGNDNLLALNLGENGAALFAINGSTGSMLGSPTGIYLGEDITFANDSTAYSADGDVQASTGMFYIWTVTSSGLAPIPNYTMSFAVDGLGEGFTLRDGLVFGFAGGIIDPTTTPPTQLGELTLTNAFGTDVAIPGTTVAPDVATGRAFLIGATIPGTLNPVLLSYDTSRYVLLGTQVFGGEAQQVDLVRWGNDGLTWHSQITGPQGGGPGAGLVYIMRGPFVLPELGMVNPIPIPVAVSPTSTMHGSGNILLAVTGSNFVPGVTVDWNGAERSTTFVDSSHLTVAIPASDVSAPGTANLTVINPGSMSSGAVAFTVN